MDGHADLPAPPRCKSLEMLFCPYLSTINPRYKLASRKDKFPSRLYGRHHLFSLLVGTKHQRRAPLTLLCTADKEQEHTDTFKSNQIPLFPATTSTYPVSGEGTRTPQVHSVPRKPLCVHQVYLCNPAEIRLELVETTSFRVLGSCLFFWFSPKPFLRKLPPGGGGRLPCLKCNYCLFV